MAAYIVNDSTLRRCSAYVVRVVLNRVSSVLSCVRVGGLGPLDLERMSVRSRGMGNPRMGTRSHDVLIAVKRVMNIIN